ncbi:Serine/threonine-protein kinase ppk16 [Trichoderma lentiforme]|uniref:Serine/threonine-protein kinase ppk16 n=1 Tax=Trichoderma lentiforme TaxID=1567552 RepID=A0A9P5CHN8_9HYPO|nr:Serine/threonine-protein kinase ppk16 [Trichoderma lentiforme]
MSKFPNPSSPLQTISLHLNATDAQRGSVSSSISPFDAPIRPLATAISPSEPSSNALTPPEAEPEPDPEPDAADTDTDNTQRGRDGDRARAAGARRRGMQTAKGKAEAQGRKAKLATSYQELLDEFSSTDLKSVGNYTLGRLIGKGSFGKVYLASHKLTNGSKVVLKSANRTDSNLAREIHHHRQFVHPHIARLYEVIVTENLVWMVLEYCAGDELYNYLLDHGPLPMPKVQKIFAQLVGAVSYVHMQSCVHRDLKLENILFDTHENVKLVDFGFTREYEGRTNHLQTFCGTICYSAPEMLKGEKYAGEKVDVWSLGIILYALLCGELPFDDDDDNVTRTKILTEEPTYPEHFPTEAIPLIKSLLSKRPLLRPSLPEILAHPFLAEHAPAQQAILETKALPPFSTLLEKDCLHRMRSAGVDTDSVIESVLAQKCDALAGWWTLLLEKEERKMRRRERKRKERENDKSLHRISVASSRFERMLQDVDEDGGLTKQFIKLGDPAMPRARGRPDRRSAHYYDLAIADMSYFTAEGSRSNGPQTPDENGRHRSIDSHSIRSVSTTRNYRPIPPPKEGILRSARSRGSTLHLVTTTESLGLGDHSAPPSSQQQDDNSLQKAKKRPSQAIIAHWKNWTHWFIENTTRRRRGHERRTSRSVPDLHKKEGSTKSSNDASPRPQTSKYPNTNSLGPNATAPLPKGVVANGHLAKANGSSSYGSLRGSVSGPVATPTSQQPLRPRIATSQAYKRQSLSPSPLTPRGTAARRSSAGLRGRKSTSSSVSSVRSMHHHHHTHSKASSTSSTGSVSTSKTPLGRGHSPHHSVKVLPATPTGTAFPSNIRLVRMPPAPPVNSYNEGMPTQAPGSPNPFASGVMFAKRKKNLFKGPALSFGASHGPVRNAANGPHSHSRSGSASGLGRRSGEITIQEEDEDHMGGLDEEEEEIEEVDAFGPVIGGPGEIIEEQILEDEATTPTAEIHPTAGVHSPSSTISPRNTTILA